MNEYIDHSHFKIDTLLSALSHIDQDDYMISINFSVAYYSVPIPEHHRKYLRFLFDDLLLQYNPSPNGLKTGPHLFIKVLKVPLLILRMLYAMKIVGYLDETLVAASDSCLCATQG